MKRKVHAILTCIVEGDTEITENGVTRMEHTKEYRLEGETIFDIIDLASNPGHPANRRNLSVSSPYTNFSINLVEHEDSTEFTQLLCDIDLSYTDITKLYKTRKYHTDDPLLEIMLEHNIDTTKKYNALCALTDGYAATDLNACFPEAHGPDFLNRLRVFLLEQDMPLKRFEEWCDDFQAYYIGTYSTREEAAKSICMSYYDDWMATAPGILVGNIDWSEVANELENDHLIWTDYEDYTVVFMAY